MSKNGCNFFGNKESRILKYGHNDFGQTEYITQGKFLTWSNTEGQGSYALDGSEPQLKTKSEYDNAARLLKSILNPGGTGYHHDLTTYYDLDELSRQVRVFDPQQWEDRSATPPNVDDVCTKYVYDNGSRLKEVIVAYKSGDKSTTRYTGGQNQSNPIKTDQNQSKA